MPRFRTLHPRSESDRLGTDTRSFWPLVCRVPTRRTPRPDWVLARRVALGHRLAQLRQAAELSQEELGNLAGLERRTIQRFEAGARDPRYSDLLLLAHALRVHVTDLLL
ncbi:helix-turn-helix domain-containing protein [Streptomyces alfalfae]|uniref:helix-turn-helix domain-containing protein n=1 Tax=Streptomyces alfalfae TaxID=1642299 RepID=UPI00281220AC|nr:helix-turn-helix transcriptional regulator [Streptomyces alfalfae]